MTHTGIAAGMVRLRSQPGQDFQSPTTVFSLPVEIRMEIIERDFESSFTTVWTQSTTATSEVLARVANLKTVFGIRGSNVCSMMLSRWLLLRLTYLWLESTSRVTSRHFEGKDRRIWRSISPSVQTLVLRSQGALRPHLKNAIPPILASPVTLIETWVRASDQVKRASDLGGIPAGYHLEACLKLSEAREKLEYVVLKALSGISILLSGNRAALMRDIRSTRNE